CRAGRVAASPPQDAARQQSSQHAGSDTDRPIKAPGAPHPVHIPERPRNRFTYPPPSSHTLVA
ncbi:hypothetical protein NGM37_42285, partial [Streptomyces sp. TRM76130]|nr:hypothetical protein [Streptomyces sp. TRM76130]